MKKPYCKRREPGIYETETGWRLIVSVRGDDWPKARKNQTKPKRITDHAHKIGMKELRDALAVWRVEAKKSVNGGRPASEQGVCSLRNDLAVYQSLPQFLNMTTQCQDERVMQLTALIGLVQAQKGVAGPDRSRLTIKKQEWEVILGAQLKARKWKPGAYNKWLGALKVFYNALENPDMAEPNPTRKIKLLKVAAPEPMNIDYRVIVKILARLKPAAWPNADKRLSFQTEHLVWRLAHEGVPNTKLATMAGVSEAAIRKLLRRGVREHPVESEVIYHAFNVQAFTGMRPVQWDLLQSHDFDAEARTVKVHAAKGDRGVLKELEDYGVKALQDAFAANAVRPYDRSNARRRWYAEFKALDIPKPWPYPYQLKHSYLTEAMIGTNDPDAVREQSGHRRQESLGRYTEAAKQGVRRRVADAFGARMQGILAPPTPTKGRKGRGALALFEKPVAPQLTATDYRARGGPKRMFGK